MRRLRQAAALAVAALFFSPLALATDVDPVTKVKQTGGDELFVADVYAVTGKNRVGADCTQAGSWTFTGTVAQGVQGTSTSPWYVNLRNASGTEIATASAPLRCDPTGSTIQPVSGTVTANQGTSPWVTSRNWTLSSGTDSVASVESGTWVMRLQDGSGNAVTSQTNGGQRALDVGIDVSGTQIDPRSIRALTSSDVVTANAGSGTFAVSAASLPLPSGAATSANQTTEITSLQILDDVPAAQNGAFVKGETAMGQLDDTSTTAATEDNVAAIRITAQRAEHVNLRNAAGTEIGTSGAPVRTDPTGTTPQPSSQSGTWTTGRTWTLASGTDSVQAVYTDSSPSTGTVSALDTSTTTLVGSNGQMFYIGTPTANSAATFSFSSIETVQIQATLLGTGGTMVVEVSQDGGVLWLRPTVFQISTQLYSNGFTAPFSATLNVAGMNRVRVRATVSWSGTATIAVVESLNTRSIAIGESLPPGTNVVGGVTESGTWTVAQGTAAALAGAWPFKLTDGTNTAPTMDVAARAGFQKLTDGTNTAAVKAASTAPVATDPAIVVAISPNGGQATAANQATEITSLQLIDDVPAGMNAAFSKGAPAMGQLDDTSTTDATEDNVAPVRITSKRAIHMNMRNNGGTEFGTLSTPFVVSPSAGLEVTYSASFSALVPALLATDVVCIKGSGTKTVRVTRIEASGTSTASGAAVNLTLVKRSTADTGGTSSTLTNVPLDSTSAAATAVAVSYTANPTLGTTIGSVRAARLDFVTVGASVVPVVWTFGDRPTSALALIGTAEQACLNMGGVTITGPVVDGSVEWTER